MKKSAAVGGTGDRKSGTPFGGVFKVFALSVALTLAYSSVAFADTVTNLLDNTPAPTQFEEISINEGETRNVPFRVLAGSDKYPPKDDGEKDCNVDSGEALELGFNSTNGSVARENPAGSRITFQDGPDSGSVACGPDPNDSTDPPAPAPDDKSIAVRGVSRGTANITIAQPPARNTTGGGTYTYGAATFRVIVQNVAPTANNDSYNTNEDNVLTVNAPGVLGNDTDPGNNPLTAVLANPPQNGTLRLDANGSFVYTPNENFSGTDTFTYRTSDGQAESNTATVSINVAAVNDRPDAAPDTLSTEEDRPAVVNVLDNDTDVDGGPLTVTSSTKPANGTANCTPAGACTYVPNNNFNGVDTFTYTVSDGRGGTATAMVTVSVGAANDAPNAAADNYQVPEDGTLNVAAPGVLGNDDDPDNDALTARLDRGVGNGTLDLNPDGSFTYTPNANYNGRDSFTYRACDDGTPQLCSEPATVEITVNPVNDPPVARGRTVPVDEDGQVEVDALANDSDADGDPLVITDFTQPQNGMANCTPGGVCTYTPDANYNGPDSFTYTISDGNGGTSTATINVVVRPVNDPPTARDDSYSASEDQPLRVVAPGILGNDSDPENNRLRALLESGPSNGTLDLNPDGSFVYTPNKNFSGQDSFTYRANDDLDDSNVATVTINVAETNDSPTARNDAAATEEDDPVTVNVLGNDTPGPADEAGQTLTTEAITTRPQNGTAEINADGTITYTPDANFGGEDSLVYRVCDSGDPRECDTATVNVTVNPVNDPARAQDDAAATEEDDPVTVNVLGNDTPGPADESRQNLTVTNVTDPANGTAEIIREGENAGQVRYTPDPNYSGLDSFEYRVCDSGNPQGCDTATVNVTVNAQNDPPSAEDDRRTVAEDDTLDFPASQLTENDSPGPGEGGQALTVTRVSNPQNGTVRLEDGRVIFRPDPDYNGPASFTYTVCDGGEPRECDTATVNVDVGAMNDAPAARDDEAGVPEDGSVEVDVLANDTDADGKGDLNPLSVRVVEGPSYGTATVDRLTGEITYTPNRDYSGPDSFTYEVCDDQGACDSATVVVNVDAANDPPVARDDRGSTNAAALVANAYVSQYASPKASSPTGLYRVDTSSSPFAFGKIGKDIARPLNAIGYRSTDRSLYGYRIVKPFGIVRADPSTGDARYLGNPRGLPVTKNKYLAGDVSPDGSTYYLYGQNSGVLRVVDLSAFRTRSVKLSSNVAVADLAVSPTNGKLYGVNDEGRLLEIDPNTGGVTAKNVPSLVAGGYGATWFTAEGDLIAYENGERDTAGSGTLYQIENPTTETPSATNQGSGRYTIGNDGAAFVAAPDQAGLSVGVNVLENDEDPDGKLVPSTVRVLQPPEHGTARVNSDGSITYTTDASYQGSDSFRYEVCDDDPTAPQCAAATVRITAAPLPAAGGPSARKE